MIIILHNTEYRLQHFYIGVNVSNINPCVCLFTVVIEQFALLHKCAAPQMPCSTNALLHKCPAPQMLCSTNALLHKCSAPQMPCSTNALLHKCPAPQMLCSTNALLHKCSAPQMPCSTNALLHKCSAPQMSCSTNAPIFHVEVWKLYKFKPVNIIRVTQIMCCTLVFGLM